MLCNLITGQVAGHDKDGIFTLDGLALAIGEPALGQNNGKKKEINMTEKQGLEWHSIKVTPNTLHTSNWQ